MAVAKAILHQISTLTGDLIEAGLCNEQNFPVMMRTPSGGDEVTFAGSRDLAVSLKNLPYADVYAELRSARSFNFFMIDGALVQIQCRLLGDRIDAHRLAFFPSPDLTEYQNNPEIYEQDEIYADVVMRNIVPAPIRFDFDRGAFVEDHHPMSHLTLGQYKNCRIPVSGPLSPYAFVHFVLRAFYNTGFRRCCERLTRFQYDFDATITERERAHLHLVAAAAG